MKIFVSSYAAYRATTGIGDKKDEGNFFDGLAAFDLAGLELPFTGQVHAYDEAWLQKQIRPEWQCLLTLLPGTMNILGQDPHFGLASTDKEGRKRAIQFCEEARQTIQKWHDALRRQVFKAVILHSAPSKYSSAMDFSQSLLNLGAQNWDGAELLIEHCDALVDDHAPEKGFLLLRDELKAIQHSVGKTKIRLLINWGRSAIETRSAQGPLDHIRQARQHNLLAGVFFSGATENSELYGHWRDRHAPFSSVCKESLLTQEKAQRVLTEAGNIDYLGLKIQPLPISLKTAERLKQIKDCQDLLKALV